MEAAEKAYKIAEKAYKIEEKAYKIAEKAYKDALLEKREKEQKYVWIIYAISDKHDHRAGDVGFYSSYEKAKSYILKDVSSSKFRDECKWNYSIIQREATLNDLKKLDEPPPNYFPYDH